MIAQFALRLLLGMSLTWLVLPRKQITSGFFRIQFLVALGLSILATVSVGDLVAPASRPVRENIASSVGPALAMPKEVGVGLGVALAVCSFLGSVAWTLERRRGGTVFLFAIAALTAGLLIASVVPSLRFRPAWAFHALSELSSAAILGSCVTTMLLGHWYLTATGMALAPLERGNVWFGATIVARAVCAAIGIGLAGGIAGTWQQTLISLRWGAGIVLPLIMCVMVGRILRYRNTQSATGVLFAAVILVFLGELAGMLLSREIGAPL